MSAEGPSIDDRAERYAAATTPEERAAVLGLDYAALKRVGLRGFVFLTVTLVLVVFVGILLLSSGSSQSDLGAKLLALGCGMIVAFGTILVGGLVARRVGRRDDHLRWNPWVGAGTSVLALLLLAIAAQVVPRYPDTLLILGVISALASGSVLNLLTPRSLARMIARGHDLAPEASDQVRASPGWVTGFPPSAWPAVTVIVDGVGWGAAVVLFATSALWVIPVAIVSLLCGVVWWRAVRRDQPWLGIATSVVTSAVLVITAIIAT